MQRIERYLLSQCVEALIDVHAKLKDTEASTLVQRAKSGKADSLYLDVFPENILRIRLVDEYDKHIVLVTEEKGQFNYQEINEAEVVIFSDPTDRSKYLKIFIEEAIQREIIKPRSLFRELLESEASLKLWEEVGGAPAGISGGCCSLTVVKRGEILFTLLLNYVTEEIVLASREYLARTRVDTLQNGLPFRFRDWDRLQFPKPVDDHSYVTFLGKQYGENLEKTGLLDGSFRAIEHEPGGPARILYLSNLSRSPVGFILSNGEKIGEWLGWLAFCRYSEDLVAYSVYPGTFFAKDDVLMTPSPPYSILHTRPDSVYLNYQKLRYFENPSRYRELILVCHRRNATIRARVEASKSRQLLFK